MRTRSATPPPSPGPAAGRVGTGADAGPAAGAAGVIVGRRGGLATGRAVLGGLLVAAAAVVVFASALGAAGHRGRPYVVATRPLAAGSVIGPGDTTTRSMSLPSGTRQLAFADPSELIGRRLAVDVAPGALIESPVLAPGPTAALRPVSIPVDPDSLAALAPGDPVDVLELPGPATATAPASAAPASAAPTGAAGAATPSAAGSQAPAVTVVLRGAQLLSVTRGPSGLLGTSATGTGSVVTLGVSDLSEAEAVVEAAHAGMVELVRALPSDGTGAGTAGG